MKDIINLKFITFSPAIYIVRVSERNTLVFIIILMNMMNLHITMSVLTFKFTLTAISRAYLVIFRLEISDV